MIGIKSKIVKVKEKKRGVVDLLIHISKLPSGMAVSRNSNGGLGAQLPLSLCLPLSD